MVKKEARNYTKRKESLLCQDVNMANLESFSSQDMMAEARQTMHVIVSVLEAFLTSAKKLVKGNNRNNNNM